MVTLSSTLVFAAVINFDVPVVFPMVGDFAVNGF